ncbi:MAG: 3-deoxy-manno-octulosonate cytidylyltransferase, partial [Bacteroidia bacterium]|nr:3-deoxy-manno-octulosonate cytidylyltransferase [Bacteroidia bacterium]
MNVIGVIPARFDSTRFPGKALVDIYGKSMIERVYRQCEQSKLLNNILVATDDQRIQEEVHFFRGNCIMTSPNH